MTAPAASPADESAWPLLPEERTWGAARLTLTLATTAAATWCYLIGESVGSTLGFIKGGLALSAGCMMGMLLVLLAAGPTCVRFGIDSIAATKPQFGTRGWVVPAALQAVSIIGWNSLLIIFFAKSAVQLCVALGILEMGWHNAAWVPALTVLACAIILTALRRGAIGVSIVSNILVAHVFIGLWMLYLPVPVLSLIGIAGSLVLKSSDPTEWLRIVGGPAYAIVSLTFVTAANFGTTTAGIYASAIGLRNFAALQKRTWTTLLLITIAPVALVGIFIPELFFAKFGNFLALIGVAFAPLCGIQIVDYFVLRRGRINLRAMYIDAPARPYYFWRGVNPAAMIALAAGCLTYIVFLNPLSYGSTALYPYLTASLPSAAAAALVYFLASLLVIRAGRGGYRHE